MTYQYSDNVKNMRPSIIRELLKQMSDPDLISFAGGNPDSDAFPLEQIQTLSERLLREDPMGVLQYSITEGYPGLIESGTDYLNTDFDVVREEDSVIITSGSQQIMDLLTRLLCNPGDVVASDDPAFLGAINCFRGHGCDVVSVPLQEDGPDLEALEAVLSATPKPKFFYTIPNFQNPTGVTQSLEKRKAIYALCLQYNVPILEDNPYGELLIHSDAVPPIKSFDTEGIVVYAASMSKVFAPGMRVAFCVAPKEVNGKMVTAKQSSDVHTNLWSQRVCDSFLRECDMGEHLVRLRGIYTEKADFMCDQFDAKLAGRIHYQRPQGGMFIWPQLPDGADMEDFVQRCLDKKLAVVPGNAFYVDDSEPCRYFRANFSTPSLEQIEAGVDIIDTVLKEMGYE